MTFLSDDCFDHVETDTEMHRRLLFGITRPYRMKLSIIRGHRIHLDQLIGRQTKILGDLARILYQEPPF